MFGALRIKKDNPGSPVIIVDLSEDRPSQLKENLVKEQQNGMARLDLSLYFQCGVGEFISLVGKCDGMRDCISGRDEDHCDNSSMSILCNHFFI